MKAIYELFIEALQNLVKINEQYREMLKPMKVRMFYTKNTLIISRNWTNYEYGIYGNHF